MTAVTAVKCDGCGATASHPRGRRVDTTPGGSWTHLHCPKSCGLSGLVWTNRSGEIVADGPVRPTAGIDRGVRW